MKERFKKILIIILENFLCVENLPAIIINPKISYQDARNIAVREIQKISGASDKEIILIEQFTIKKEFGWIFIYNSKAFFLSKNEEFALAGNAPFIVDNRDGRVTSLGTADSILYYSKLYREYRDNPNDFKKYFYISNYSDHCWILDVFGWIIIPVRNKIAEYRWKKMK